MIESEKKRTQLSLIANKGKAGDDSTAFLVSVTLIHFIIYPKQISWSGIMIRNL